MNTIQVSGLSKVYGIGTANETTALRSASFVVRKGSSVAIMGPSGSGKSTLLNILGGLVQPTSGQYRLDDVDMTGLNDRKMTAARNSRMGFVLQSFGLIEGITALSNVEIPLLFNKDTKFSKVKSIAIRAMQNVGIEHLASKNVSELSGGERQRVAIARAIVLDPTLILADEPSGQLDTENTTKIMELLMSCNKKGATVVIVTHDARVASFCDQVLTMSDGVIES